MRHARVEIYQGRDGQWYWSMIASNGRTVADGSEGYTRKRDALVAFSRVRGTIVAARVVVAGEPRPC